MKNKKWIEFMEWKSTHLDYYNSCIRELLQKIQLISHVNLIDLCVHTNLCKVHNVAYYQQVYCQGQLDVDYTPFVEFAKRYQSQNLTVM